ncbi:MAG: ureidoglycolate lyase [bacterium]|nr:ureidoglycolate lyase [bacterium]MDE0240411.1 ureidoglycolate lyase [bacterium]MDE0415434.1 ureidoglycolate lyase [bacterium]
MSIREIRVEPLTRPVCRAFGDVIERDPRSCLEINNGEVLHQHDLARVDVTAEDGRPVISIFQGLRPAMLPFRLRLMERHPVSSQAFVPLDRSEFLIVVAQRDARPATGNMRGFLARHGQGVTLHPGTWHHSLIALHAADFLVEDRSARGEVFDQDYEEESIDDEGIVVTLDTDLR